MEEGTLIDSTKSRNLPFQFQVGSGQVFQGLDVAIRHLPLHSLSEITIPSCFAYGAKGLPPKIPPGAVLIYKVEVLTVERLAK